MKTDHAFCSFCPNSVSKKEYFAIVLHSSAMFEGRYRTSVRRLSLGNRCEGEQKTAAGLFRF